MDLMDIDELAARSDEWDQVVLQTPGIDHFCSASAWSLSAHEALMPPRQPFIARTDSLWLAMAIAEHARIGRLCEPLEASWGFACPIAGPRIHDGELQAVIARVPARLTIVTGLTAGSAVLSAVQDLDKHPRMSVRPGGTTLRRRASLSGGFQGFLARRSGGFRQKLRRAERRAAVEGVELAVLRDFPDGAAVTHAFERLLDIELRSWKGRSDQGVQSGPMSELYRRMLPRLARQGSLRMAFAHRDGQDLAYHVGGIFGGVYRGLQHSFDDDVRALSVGVLTHAAMIRAVCAEGVAVYDLGMEHPYKARWAERLFESQTALVIRS